MKGWHLWTGIILLFLSGIVIGWFGHDMINSSPELEERGEVFTEKEFMTLHERFMGAFYNLLDLTDEQRREVNVEVRKTVDEIFVYRDKIQPEIDEIVDRALARIKEHLDTEQITRLENFHRTIIAIREMVLDRIHQEYGYKSDKNTGLR